jgi:sirohydrochlorin cobaltochelatase
LAAILSSNQTYVRQITSWGKPASAPEHLTGAAGEFDLPVNEALLLIGHGSVRYPDAAAPVHRHAQALRNEGRVVAVAMLNGAPSIEMACGRLGSSAACVVPFFMEDGYFSKTAVPRALQAAAPAIVARFTPAIGTNSGMAAIIERQALAASTALGVPPARSAVVVIGHGSAITPGRALALHRHCASVAEAGLFATVQPACLEESPFVADVLAKLRDRPTVVIGYFANQASHVLVDVPALLRAEAAARGTAGAPVRFHACVADDPAIADIIAEQAALR